MAEVENTLTAGLLSLAQNSPNAIGRALYEFAHDRVLTKAKELTPVDYGTLRDSGIVDDPTITATKISVEIGFGGGAAHYAIYVHEDLEAQHEVGQAKFLSTAMDEASGDFVDYVSAHIARALGM
jgi:hypothetical protein